VFLIFNGQPIAFEFGWIAKEVYLTPKSVTTNLSAAFSPGQLLRYLLYERFHIERSVRYVDSQVNYLTPRQMVHQNIPRWTPSF